MKISHTLIHEGISYGILEGTKAPEKPDTCIHGGFSICPHDDKKQCLCEDDQKAYLQALLSVAIQWEDQTASFKLITAPIQNKVTGKFDGGIYPLEGVEVGNVWQVQRYGTHIWTDCGEEEYNLRDFSGDVYRRIIRISKEKQRVGTLAEDREPASMSSDPYFSERLIPQPNSEQKTDWPEEVKKDWLDPKFDVYDKNPFGKYNIPKDPNESATYVAKVGVDEKKEPETVDEYVTVITPRIDYFMTISETLSKEDKIKLIEHLKRSVSEEEPNQDQAILNQINLFSEAAIIQEKQGILAVLRQFHIQKLKP